VSGEDFRTFEAFVENAAAVPLMEFSDELLLHHVLVVGATGAGKTNDALALVMHAARHGTSVLVVDPKAEYRQLLNVPGVAGKVLVVGVGKPFPFLWNPLEVPGGVSAGLWLKAFADVFTRAYGLSDPSRRILFDCLRGLYGRYGVVEGRGVFPTLRELEVEVGRFRAESPNEANSKRAVENRLHILNTGLLGDALNVPQGYGLKDFGGRIVVLELDRVPSMRDQAFVVEMLLGALWEALHHAPSSVGGLRQLVVVEEAHRYLSEARPPSRRGERSLLELAVAEGRRYGFGFVILDQLPGLLSRYVLENCATKVVHRLESWEQVRLLMDAMAVRLDTVLAKIALHSPPGYAVMKTPWLEAVRTPSLVRFPLLQRALPSDEDVVAGGVFLSREAAVAEERRRHIALLARSEDVSLDVRVGLQGREAQASAAHREG